MNTTPSSTEQDTPATMNTKTYKIEIKNTWGPYYTSMRSDMKYLDWFLGGPWSPDEEEERKQELAILVPRRFHIKIRYTEQHDISKIRGNIRNLAGFLCDMVIPEALNGYIDFLGLECELDCGAEDDGFRRDPCWNNYDPVGDTKECANMIRGWFSLPGLRGKVKEVEITGLKEDHTQFLKEHLLRPDDAERRNRNTQGSEGTETEAPSASPPPPSLLDM